jgi:hypothetical protein
MAKLNKIMNFFLLVLFCASSTWAMEEGFGGSPSNTRAMTKYPVGDKEGLLLATLPPDIIYIILFQYGDRDIRKNIALTSQPLRESLNAFTQHVRISSEATSLDFLSSFPNLKRLKLCGNFHIFGEAWRPLSELTKLRSLHLGECQNLDDQGISYLSPLINLEELNLEECRDITDQGATHLSSLTNLKKLELFCWINVTDEALHFFSSLTNLTMLDLGDWHNLTDGGVSYLTSLKNLTKLSLSSCEKITDPSLAHVQVLTNLTKLNLSGCSGITKDGLLYITSLTNLTTLNLSGCDQIISRNLADYLSNDLIEYIGGCLPNVKIKMQLDKFDFPDIQIQVRGPSSSSDGSEEEGLIDSSDQE